jgi:hypothetical protein
MYKTLSPDGVIDDRARLMFKDGVLNCGLMQQARLTTGGANDTSTLPVTLSTIATDMGLKFSANEYIAIGVRVKKAYTHKYGTEPPKHEQLCGGAVRKVCSYTQKDVGLIQAEIQEFNSGRESPCG